MVCRTGALIERLRDVNAGLYIFKTERIYIAIFLFMETKTNFVGVEVLMWIHIRHELGSNPD
jgi:hypothetical protein